LTTLTALKADSLFPVWSPDASKLAFVSSRALDGSNSVSAGSAANLWVMNADGTSAQPLTKLTAPSVDFYLPSRVQWWSPDGSKLAFASTRALDGSDAVIPAGTRNIWVINADGSGARPLTKLTASGADSFLPKWSPDGSKLAFSSFRALDGSNNANTTQLIPNVWIVNADGSGATPLTTLTAPGSVSWGPVWSPDGSKLAFVSSGALDGSNSANNQSTPNVWVVNVNGSGNHPLTKLTTAAAMVDPFDLSWSPDGNQIAFVSFRALDGSDGVNTNLTRNIWIVNADGSAARPMTKNKAVVAHSVRPIWSPDGSRIALESQAALDGSDSANTNDTTNIWVINADGSGLAPVTKLTAQGVEANEPAWRP
jgi:Tol biopolymer transport system component